MKLLTLSLAIIALTLGACKHRNKQPTCCEKNPVAYPTASHSGTVSAGYGYVK